MKWGPSNPLYRWQKKRKSRKSRKSRSSGRVKSMAKKKHKRSSSSGLPSWAKTLVSAGVAVGYGAAQDKVHSVVPAIPKVENYSDEIVIGGAAALLSVVPLGKAGKYVRLVSKPVMLIELANAGRKMAAKVPLSGQ